MNVHTRFAISGFLAVAAVAGLSLMATIEVRSAGRGEGLAAWKKIVGVLQHPRCLNCHQANEPLQGNVPRQHIPRVARGEGNHGDTVLKCFNCHGAKNNPTSRVPGAGEGHWQLAPLSMNWQGLSSGELCRMLKDKKRNGDRDGAELVAHMNAPDGDPLVLWGWEPGKGRDPVPLPHKDFIALLKVWVASGQVCPK